MALYIGLMSGTSLDGVDGVLADFDPSTLRPLRTLAHAHRSFEAGLRDELLALNRSGHDELHRAALASNGLMLAYAEVVAELLNGAGRRPRDVVALGAHGQTVRHQPGAFDGLGYTVQLANGALLAERSGITVVCDFRSADVAAGGQGAPLVPAFHAACLSEPGQDGALLNIGGIANLTLLSAAGAVGGFDTGPGNLLIDLWCQRAWGEAYDDGGRRAASGQVDTELLARLLADPYFAAPPPKSTGRDHFHGPWLDRVLAQAEPVNPVDVLTTLAELTAASAAEALQRTMPGVRHLRVCGGGAFNGHLMARLQARLPGTIVESTTALGVPADQVEALAFAWLAAQRLAGRAATLAGVTGARGARISGAVHLAP